MAHPSSPAEFQLYVEGDALYAAMLEDIGTAESTIRMESYIFSDDAVGRRIAAALMAQARRGLQVILRIDYAGSRWQVGSGFMTELRAAGVQFEWSHRWRWARPWAFHRRNHRKLLIIDDALAYLGGFNVYAASSRECVGEGRWRDTHVRFCGAAVHQAIGVFERPRYVTDTGPRPASRLWVLPNATRSCRRRLCCEIDHVLRTARRRIWLTTPYFVPDRRLRRQLVRAVHRGVDVRVLTPAKSDVQLARWAAHALYGALLKRGVQVYEYRPRVLHAKTLVIDDAWATVGTANLDYRSLFANAEVNLIGIGGDLSAALAEQFQSDLESAEHIEPDRWRRRSWTDLAREAIAWPLRKWL